ncbi:uncharacterized protein LOC142181914 [Nicotiana tabacum]|uniref:Uncharacterized protein LOC142181914 n=1 Tax=Nicotiana tabacum TaxID=4097 RepID=A0AC58UQC9_TOBAC
MCFMDIKEDNNENSCELGLMEDEGMDVEDEGMDVEEESGELGLRTDEGTSEEHREKNRKGKWYLDSVCSRHMTGDKSLCKTVIKLNGGTVTFGDKSKGNVIGVGKVPLSSTCEVDEVYMVDELGYNLLKDESGKVILSGNRDRNIYTISNIDNLGNQICLASMIDDVWVWHRKHGHSSMHTVQKFTKHDLVIGLSKLDFSKDHICDACQLGKQIRSSFKIKNIVSTTKPLQLLHMDLFGPTRTGSIGGRKYVFVIVDDFSCFTWVIFLSHNDEALRNFEVFCKKVQHKKGYYISTIRSDHGGHESIHVVFVDTNPRSRNEKLPEDEEISIIPKSFVIGKDCQDEPTSQQNQSTKEHIEIQESSYTEQSTTKEREPTTNVPKEWKSEHRYPQKFIIVYSQEGITTRKSQKLNSHMALISQLELKKVDEALKYVYWIKAMKDELHQFERNKVWKWVPKPSNASIVGINWVFRNKLNESRQVVRNKGQLVSQGYSQQEGIDYDETFALVA